MLLKEQGYNEFLAQKIKNAEQDILAGRILTKEQSLEKTRALIEKKAREQEINQLNNDVAIYG